MKGPPAVAAAESALAPGAGAPDSWNRFADRQSITLKLERERERESKGQTKTFIHADSGWVRPCFQSVGVV